MNDTNPSAIHPILGGGEPPAECKRPTEGAWTRIAKRGNAELFQHCIADLWVLSTVDFIPVTEGGNGWEYHISICKLRRGRPTVATDDQARLALRAFGMLAAGEDNHTPGGVARNFWLPVNGSALHCDCLAAEEPRPMGDGTTGAVWREDGKDRRPGPLEPT
jgi:hypothetical protein